jgi:hypothetical protein
VCYTVYMTNTHNEDSKCHDCDSEAGEGLLGYCPECCYHLVD